MDNKMKVSVIVPVYNVEKYIRQCLDSLVNQTLKEIEIIVVNDGSPDNSQAIIDEFVEKYPSKIFSLVKKNGGLGDARNYGLKFARGQYIGFVDSDDWVDPKMYEAMYSFAIKSNYDVVICDFTSIYDGWTTGWRSTGYRGKKMPVCVEDYILHSLDPATACNKLIKASLFEIVKFTTGWYEDIATTPILLSYSNNIGYLPVQLYYYRQHKGSIIYTDNNIRNLDVIDAWNRVLQSVKKEYFNQMVYAVYKNVYAFIHFKPKYADQYLQFIKNNKDLFYGNAYIKNEIESKNLENLMIKRLIPKKIHYFWFGGNPKNELIEKCMASWKKYAPDYEIIEWNESNCDIHECPYVEEAYERKKWAFVADYFRLKVIYEHGGIYVDTDVEFTNEISILRLNSTFFGFETKNAVNACIFGSIPGTKIVKELLDSYQKDSFIRKDGSMNTSYTIVTRLTKLLVEKYELKLNGKKQVLKDDIAIYPTNVLLLDMYDGNNLTQHHYDASWWDVKEGCTSYKYEVLKDFFTSQNDFQGISTSEIETLRKQLNDIINSTSWKITAPMRKIMDILRATFKRKSVRRCS